MEKVPFFNYLRSQIKKKDKTVKPKFLMEL